MFPQYFVLLQLVVFYFGSSNSDPFIGKSRPAKKDEFPFMVSLSRRKATIKKERHFCGGALITKRHVLTSAHCFKKRQKEDVVVIAGSVNIESGVPYAIGKLSRFDEWAVENNRPVEYENNDITILTLEEDVKAPAKPGVISKLTHDQVIEKRNVITAGWGYINETTKEWPKSLMRARFRLMTLEEYEEDADEPVVPSNTYYTVGYPAVMLGCGDSGGPLFLQENNEIVGINESSCDIEDPEDYDDVTSYHIVLDYYRDFIKHVTESCSAHAQTN